VRRHETDYFSLSAGLLFVILGVMFAVAALADWSFDLRWILPVMLIVLGAGGVAASLASTRREQVAYSERLANHPTADEPYLGGSEDTLSR
jgi:hypothetical protein